MPDHPKKFVEGRFHRQKREKKKKFCKGRRKVWSRRKSEILAFA